jgi:hypothetical protein
MKTYSLSIGRAIGYAHPSPERTAVRNGSGIFSDNVYQVWSNRASMARSIRMQQRREHRSGDWRALVALTDTEGY